MSSPLGWILWAGLSRLDRRHRIRVILGAGPSTNPKTGPARMLWVLPDAESPLSAWRNGRSGGTCGACPLAGVAATGAPRSCNVRWDTLGSLTGAIDRGRYVQGPPPAWSYTAAFIRAPMFGELPAAPLKPILPILKAARGHVGYTHAWRHPAAAAWRPFLMASVETGAQAREAQRRGWRTYRLAPGPLDLRAGEIACPHYGPEETMCIACGACRGGPGPGIVGITRGRLGHPHRGPI